MSKPYSALLLRYPEQKEELALLPHWFYEVLAAFPYKPNRYGNSNEPLGALPRLAVREDEA